MKRFFTVFLLLLCSGIDGQVRKAAPQDTLFQRLPGIKNDTNKLVTLKRLSIYFEYADISKEYQCCQQGLKLATALKNNKYITLFHILFAQNYIAKNDSTHAISHLDTAYGLAKAHHDLRGMAFACGDYALIYENLGRYPKAQEYLFQALSLAEQMNDHNIAATQAANIGTIYDNQQNNEKAIYYGKMALDISKKYPLNSTIPATKAYELLATVYFKQHKVAAARANINEALAIYRRTNDEVGIALCYSHLADFSVDDLIKMRKYALTASTMWAKLAPNNFYAIGSLQMVGAAYADMVRFNKWQTVKDSIPLSIRRKVYLHNAQQYFNQALGIAKATDAKFYIVNLSDSLARLEAFTGKYKDAYNHLQQHNALYDSLYSQENKNKIAGIEEQHEISLRDKQLQINRLQIANQRKQAVLLIGALVVLIGISLLIYLQSRARKRTNAKLLMLNTQLDEANRVKMKFFSILNHDLKQPVAGFVNLLHLQEAEPDLVDEQNRQKHQKRLTNSAENLLDKMEDLLLWAKGQMENFSPQVKDIAVNDLFSYIGQFFESSNVKIEFQSPPGMLLQTDEYSIKTITQNLTGNAIKALSKATAPLITWQAWEAEGKKYLAITDNGPGATNQQMRALYDDSAAIGIQHGLGLHIVRDMAKAIGCKVTVINGEGQGLKIQLEL